MLLAAAIERRFPGVAVRTRGSEVLASLPGGHEAVAQLEPVGRVAIALPTDGFELGLRWTDRHRSARPTRFDDSYLVETNDISLAHAWLDHEARASLLASRYVADAPAPMRATVRLVRDGAWQHFIRDGEVGAVRADAELSVERVADVLAATVALADRPARWARVWARLARELGGTAATRVELAGRPIVQVQRGGAEIAVRLLRRFTNDDPGRLRTLVGAHRHGSGGDTLALISDDLPISAWPPPAYDPRASALRVDPTAARLVEIARPSTAFVRAHDVEITFDGAMIERARLGAAIELAARWAGSSSAGPYR